MASEVRGEKSHSAAAVTSVLVLGMGEIGAQRADGRKRFGGTSGALLGAVSEVVSVMSTSAIDGSHEAHKAAVSLVRTLQMAAEVLGGMATGPR